MNMFSERVHLRERQRLQTRTNVLTAAEKLFRERGYEATTIRNIASAAEVSTGTVIAVGDKDTLLVTVYDEWISRTHRNRRAVVMDRSGRLTADAAPSAIFELFTPFVEHFARDPDLSRAYAAVIVSGTVDSKIFRQLREALLAEIQATLERIDPPLTRTADGAQVIYFGYLGLLMSTGVRTEPDEPGTGNLPDIIDFVVTSSLPKGSS